MIRIDRKFQAHEEIGMWTKFAHSGCWGRTKWGFFLIDAGAGRIASPTVANPASGGTNKKESKNAARF